MAEVARDFGKAAQDFGKLGKDAAYVAVGLGVLGFQKAQVRRREMMSRLEDQGEMPLGEVRKEVEKALKELDRGLGQVIERVDARLEPIEQLLPPSAQALMQQAKEARDQVRTYLFSFAA